MKLEDLQILNEFGGTRGDIKKDKGKETSIIRMVLKKYDVSPQKLIRHKDKKEVARTAYSDKTKSGHSFKIYLSDTPDNSTQEKIKKDIITAIPGAVVLFGPTEGGQYNYDRSPFIRVRVENTHKEEDTE